jgi:hypothetical protein
MTRPPIILAVLAACTAPAPQVRFANQPPVEVVDDRRDVPKAPSPREFNHKLYHYDGSFHRRVTRTLEVRRPQRALGINALDEVPDSTWFTNRIGVRALTPDAIRRGPTVVGSPEAHKPWTVRSTKVGGASIGFTITDARGEKFLLKFDQTGVPEVETATDVIVNRLLWAAGYNVPEDHVVYFDRRELLLAPDATQKDKYGRKTRLTEPELDRRLGLIERGSDGRFRGMTSRILDGKWLGGHAGEGVREDDPNDRIPHELRRDLRGSQPIFAWLDHIDVKEDNYLDMWVADPADPGRHYVKHYLIDFGKSLGAMATISRDPRRGHVYAVDFGDMLGSFLTGGMNERSWERCTAPALRGVGRFSVGCYDPGGWKPYTPAYAPFHDADRIDKLWGARIVMSFTREQLRAAVDAGRLSDPRAAQYLVDTLVARQRATALYWFARTDPLDRFAIDARGLCFDDLALVHRLVVAPETRYAVSLDGGTTTLLAPEPGGRTCTAPLAIRDYSIVKLEVRRAGLGTGTFVHIARDPRTRAPRVIGIWRR